MVLQRSDSRRNREGRHGDKTNQLSQSCMKNFDTRRDAVEKEMVKLEAATETAKKYNSEKRPQDDWMHVIAPIRKGHRAGFRVVQSFLPPHRGVQHSCPQRQQNHD